jgi:hypothetical protein
MRFFCFHEMYIFQFSFIWFLTCHCIQVLVRIQNIGKLKHHVLTYCFPPPLPPNICYFGSVVYIFYNFLQLLS